MWIGYFRYIKIQFNTKKTKTKAIMNNHDPSCASELNFNISKVAC